MKPGTIIQKLKPKTSDEFSAAEAYYNVLSSINKLNLTEREVQLIAFTAIRGNISTPNVRAEFCDRYSTTIPTISNIISKLKKTSIFIKEKGKVKVNPVIVLDFSKPIVLQITLENESR
ncbi:MAG: hypothetical protein EHM25_01635 [Nitrosopumilales archaeon]|nr:MAG: hypothetical protein EHM25_01635 [Nitrosopumilales archaeon]